MNKGIKLTDLDIEVLRTFMIVDNDKKGAEKLLMSHNAFRYHIAKIHKITGYNPRIPAEMMLLYWEYLQ